MMSTIFGKLVRGSLPEAMGGVKSVEGGLRASGDEPWNTTRYPGEWEHTTSPHGILVVRDEQHTGGPYVRGWRGAFGGGEPTTLPCASVEAAKEAGEKMLAGWETG